MKKPLAAIILFLLWLYPTVVAIPSPPVVAVVGVRDADAFKNAVAGFKQEFSRSARGATFIIIHSTGQEMIKETAALKPDLIFSLGAAATKTILTSAGDIPVVYAMVVDPLGSGIFGENATGVSLDIPYDTQLKTLKQLIPTLRSVAVLYNPGENKRNMEALEKAASELNIRLIPHAVENPQEIPHLPTLGAGALLIIPDGVVCQPAIIKNLLLESLKDNIPVMGISPLYAQAGALAALTGDYLDVGKQAGELAARIYNGEQPVRLRNNPPRKYLLYLNNAVAERLRIAIPDDLLRSAEEVYGQ